MKDQFYFVMSITFRLMTYNVHSCIGSDKKSSPERIAEVIADYQPDIVALQELDFELSRSKMLDQAKEIAGYLNMHFHFHPSFGIEEGYYGNAVLSRYPLRLVKAEELPSFRHRRLLEKRGVLWVEVRIEAAVINLINTHLGLNQRERGLQIDKLLGAQWLGSPGCNASCILCGDFNATPLSPEYRKIIRKLGDAQKRMNGHRPKSTWPSLFPIMRLDHIFEHTGLHKKDLDGPLKSIDTTVEYLDGIAEFGRSRLRRHTRESFTEDSQWLYNVVPENLSIDPEKPVIEENVFELISSSSTGIFADGISILNDFMSHKQKKRPEVKPTGEVIPKPYVLRLSRYRKSVLIIKKYSKNIVVLTICILIIILLFLVSSD